MKPWCRRFLLLAALLSALPSFAIDPPGPRPQSPPPPTAIEVPPPIPTLPLPDHPEESPYVRRYLRPPLLWDNLRQSLSLTRRLIAEPELAADEQQAIVRTIKRQNKLIADEAGSEDLIFYLVGSAFLNPDAREVLQNLEYIQEQAKLDHPTIRRLVERADLRQMLGAIGQDAGTNRDRFNTFIMAAAAQHDVSTKWVAQFEKVVGDVTIYDQKYHRQMRWYRNGANLVAGLLTLLGAAPGLGALLSHQHSAPALPPDLQIMAGGMLGLWIGAGPLHRRILEWGDRRVRPNIEEDQKTVEDGLLALYTTDPERTGPYLANNVMDGVKNERAKPLGDISFRILMQTSGVHADRALVTLGIFFLREGDGESARGVFEELAKREPDSVYGQFWAEMRDWSAHLQDADSQFNALRNRSRWKKTAVLLAATAAALIAAVHFLSPEQISSLVVIVRDLAIGEVTFHGGSKLIEWFERGRVHRIMEKAQAELVTKLRKLPPAGDHGLEILFALASSKIHGPLGQTIRESAKTVLRDSEGFAAAHVLARLGNASKQRPHGAELIASAKAQNEAQQTTLQNLCKLNFATISRLPEPKVRKN